MNDMDKLTGQIKGALGIDVPTTTRTHLERDKSMAAMIAPGMVDFSSARHMEIDGAYRRAYGIREFSTMNVAGWGSLFSKVPSTRATITVEPSDGVAIKRALDHADARAGVNLISGGSASRTVDNELNREHARTQLAMMADQKKTFVKASFTYQIESPTEAELASTYRSIVDAARPRGFTIDPCARAQELALRDNDPMNTHADAYLGPRFAIDMPADTLAASAPFATGGIIDGSGVVLGTDGDGSMVRVDMVGRTSCRPNGNGCITGGSGYGKSYTMKRILMAEYAQGSRVIWIDPEQEGKHLCKKLYGQYINAGGASKAMLCPLQPRALNFDFDDDGHGTDEAVVGVLRSTINHVRGFYQLAFLTPTAHLPYLDKALLKAYANHGLTYETRFEDVNFDDYPSMDELAQIMADMAQEQKREHARAIYEELSVQTATGGVNGLFGNLWSGPTNVRLTSDFIVFDVNSLMSGNVSTAARNAQIYNILSFVWGEVCMSRVSGKPLRLIVDEAHMLLGCDSDTATDVSPSPIAAALLAMISRRARKYNASLLIATQRLSDFLDPAVRRHGEALVENSTYQFAFSTKNVAPVRELMHIPASLARRLPEYERGRCVFKAGTSMCELFVEDAPAERAWMGKAGGK